jgi:small-conductance mechanosensitive channel
VIPGRGGPLRWPTAAALAAALTVAGATLVARTPQTPPPQAPSLGASLNIERAAAPATLTYFNRPILIFRASIAGRLPADRARVAVRIMDDLIEEGITSPVSVQQVDGGSLVLVGGRYVLAVSVVDVDELAGETLADVTARTVARLEIAIDEAVEARRLGLILQNAAVALGGIAVGALTMWALGRLRRWAVARLNAVAEATAAKTGLADRTLLRASRLLDFQRRTVASLTAILQLAVLYSVVTFALQQFPYTRPWGESLGGFLLSTLRTLGLGIVHAIPGLFTVVLIVILTRVATRLLGLWFLAVERGTIRLRWLHPDTVQASRRLVTTLLWLFAIIVAFPYLPGSGTDVFKGVSVFVGLIVSLGSSGLMTQIMSGFLITFSRALRVGDYVRIGDIEGTVTAIGVLSTKVRTLTNDDVTIPHAVVVSQTTTDYSRREASGGVLTPISVTIGYDAPWRQVHALLLEAADRTPGLRNDPRPHVRQSALEDFYVRYTLYVALDRQQDRLVTIDALNQHIQDAFNEHGVQIMSPNYVLDPATPKVVPKTGWFAAPAKPDA